MFGPTERKTGTPSMDFVSNKKETEKPQANDSKTLYEKVKSSGVAQGVVFEPIPDYNKADCEEVWEGTSNCMVILGRDRDGSWGTGEGRKPKRGAASITFLTGRMTNNPNLSDDGASICISENSLVDRKYDLFTPSGDGEQTQTRSSIGMKADDVRMVGRRTLRLVTTSEPPYASSKALAAMGMTPAAGSNTGIEIIANNEIDTLQPMVLGKNLEATLRELVAVIEQLIQLQIAYYGAQNDLNMTLTDHMHFTGFYDNISLFSEPVTYQGIKTICNHLQDYAMGNLKFMKNQIGDLVKDRLTETGGSKYINSAYNKVN